MAIGDRVDETGLVMRRGARVILQVDGGGEWELELFPSELRFLGRRARIRGRRSGYIRVDVEKIEPA